jgi:biotin transport system substrate-specific component
MARVTAYRWTRELSVARKVLLSLGMACVAGLLAQARVQLPFTPVPITGQTFAALLAGVLLGQWWGGLSMVMYAGLGVAGVPWFNGWTGGMARLAGPTGGYILGFILAAFVIGYITDRYVQSRRFGWMVVLMTVANFILIYVPGLVQLGLWLNVVSGKATGVPQVLAMGLVPFIAGDVVKAVAAASVAWAVTPKRAVK